MAEPLGAAALFRNSVLKQRKLAELRRCSDRPRGCAASTSAPTTASSACCCAARGGRWASADLTEEAVARSASWWRPTCTSSTAAAAAVRRRGVRPGGGRRHARARARRSGLRRRAGPHHEARRAARREHAASQAHAAPAVAPRHRPDRREARPPAPRLRRAAGCARCSRRRFELRAHRTYSRFFSELVDTAINFGGRAAGQEGRRRRGWW